MRRLVLLVGLAAAITLVAFLALSPPASASQFPDLGPNVLNGYGLQEAEVRGLSQGYPSGFWLPSNPLPRQQFVKMAVENFGIPLADPTSPTFSDVPADSIYYQYIEGAVAAGLIQGVGDNMFAPTREITRQESAAVLVRWIAKANGFDTNAIASEDVTDAVGGFGDASSISTSLRAEVAIAIKLGLLQGSGGNLRPVGTLLRIEGAALLARSSSVLASVYMANLDSLNNSGVTGVALLYLRGDQLRTLVLARGLETGKEHPQHIHGMMDGSQADCPPLAADTNMDGIISLAEGLPYYGPVLRPLDDPYPTAQGPDGMVFYSHTYSGSDLDALQLSTVTLTKRVVVLHGLTVNGVYDATVPVACGQVTALSLAYHADLDELNNSGVSGQAFLWLRNDSLRVITVADGLETGLQHLQHIHGLANGSNSTCPPLTADTNMDGIISLAEGLPYYGPVLRPLDDPYPTAHGSAGRVFYSHVYSGADLTSLDLGTTPLTNRAIVMHGLTVNDVFDATVPVACGEIEASWMTTGMVYTQTNNPSMNQVLEFSRGLDGTLTQVGAVDTNGLGATGVGHPQGAVTLSSDNRWLFAVNGGSDDISVFSVAADGLTLVDQVQTAGSLPISATTHGDWLYVLNAGDPGNITGFTIGADGHLTLIPDSIEALSATSGTNAAEIKFDPTGTHLVVTERGTNLIDVYPVDDNGEADPAVSYPSNGATPYGFDFSRSGTLIVSEAAANANSSYSISATGLDTISSSIPCLQTAPCWVTTTPSGGYAYIGNGGGPVSSYMVQPSGEIALLTSAAGPTPTGSSLDLAISGNGRFLYALAVGTEDAIGAFMMRADGSLAQLPSITGLPATCTGLAAR